MTSDSIVLISGHFHIHDLSPGLQQEQHDGGHMWGKSYLTFRKHMRSPPFLVGYVLLDL